LRPRRRGCWIGGADMGTHVTAALPERGHMKFESGNKFELAEIDVDGASHRAPIGGVAPGVNQEVVDGDKVEGDAGLRECGLLATRVA
jgi:hypothetical protein